MLMLFLFPAAVLAALVAVIADAFRSGVRIGNWLILGGLSASYGMAVLILSLNPSYQDNNSISHLGWREVFIWSLELAGLLALVVLPAMFGLRSLVRLWQDRRDRREAAPTVSLMGNGFEPHVFEIGGRLIYSQLVGFGPADVEFRFPIRQSDLSVLLADPWRRAVLEVASYRMLQYSSMPGRRKFTNWDFRRLVRTVLHTTPDQLDRLITRVSRDYNVDVMQMAGKAIARRNASQRAG